MEEVHGFQLELMLSLRRMRILIPHLPYSNTFATKVSTTSLPERKGPSVFFFRYNILFPSLPSCLFVFQSLSSEKIFSRESDT